MTEQGSKFSGREVKFGDRIVDDGQPTLIVAEIGLNHNGDVETAIQMIDVAVQAGADAVKFQKRTPEVSIPPEQRTQMRQTPWGYITYLDYRHKVEFSGSEYNKIADHCAEKKIPWFVSVWDNESVDFMERYDTPAYKIPSPALTDHKLIKYARSSGKPLILSTGMSTMEQINKAVEVAGTDKLILLHSTATYPCEPHELNLRMITTLREQFPEVPVGYSGHEVGLVPSAVAVALGASVIERHLTLDRAMWGNDQVASIEPGGFERLVKYIRVTELSLGDGVKQVYESEKGAMMRQRRVNNE